MHALVANGAVVSVADLPYSWEYPDDFADEELAGRTVSGFPFLTPEEHAAAGWLPVVDDVPDHDPATHHLADVEYAIGAGVVTRSWTIAENPEPSPPSRDPLVDLADRVTVVTAALIDEDAAHWDALDENTVLAASILDELASLWEAIDAIANP